MVLKVVQRHARHDEVEAEQRARHQGRVGRLHVVGEEAAAQRAHLVWREAKFRHRRRVDHEDRCEVRLGCPGDDAVAARIVEQAPSAVSVDRQREPRQELGRPGEVGDPSVEVVYPLR